MKNETPEQFVEAMSFANQSIPLSPTSEPNTCWNEYAAAAGSPYAPRFKEQAYVAEINQLLVRVAELEAQIAALDCRLVGRVAELSGSHCPADRPCDRFVAERRIEELSHAYAVQGLAIEDLTAERDRYRDGIRDALYMLEEQGEGSPTETAVVRDLTALLEPTK